MPVGPLPVAALDLRASVLGPLQRRFDVDPAAGGKRQLELAPPLDAVGSDGTSKARQQRAEGRLRRRRRTGRPQRLDQLAPGGRVPAQGEVDEQGPRLRAQPRVAAAPPEPDDDTAAELDAVTRRDTLDPRRA